VTDLQYGLKILEVCGVGNELVGVHVQLCV